MGLLDHLVRRSYHAIRLDGPFKIKELTWLMEVGDGKTIAD